MSGLLAVGLVDPRGGRQCGRAWRVADEALGSRGVGGVQDACAIGVDGVRLAVVDGGGGHQADPGVAVLLVVPVEEVAAERACVVDRVKAGGERGPVLERLEVRLGVGVIG